MFVDRVTVRVKAGSGGDGSVSFRHEKFVEKGGPDGGDGGNGGDVILVADPNTNTLSGFRYKQELFAENGEAGAKRKRHGKNGADLRIKVPVGTVVLEDDKQIGDLAENGAEFVVDEGGRGGFGNAHFISSTRQAPKIAEIGERREPREMTFELKLLADVGLVGLPNAGKSTFLSVVSNARPEIADYPFTTLTPNLGVATVGESTLLIADIPGLIEGASQGKGLGDQFLKHIERTRVLLHLVDIYDEDVVKAYETIRGELAAYNPALAKRPEVVVITKIEGHTKADISTATDLLKQVVPPKTPIRAVSSQAGTGIKELLFETLAAVTKASLKPRALKKVDDSVAVIELPASAKDDAWRVERREAGVFVVRGVKIEGFAARTNFDSGPGLDRLKVIMRKMGIMHELERLGVKPGNTVIV
ncbi:MAG TPA: GTPase ObgE, partial [Candidatus Saccharimonadales bacterium]|nr:GTPase ObgE [Candidatus Saccharimonadales bacterium]